MFCRIDERLEHRDLGMIPVLVTTFNPPLETSVSQADIEKVGVPIKPGMAFTAVGNVGAAVGVEIDLSDFAPADVAPDSLTLKEPPKWMNPRSY